MKMPMIAALHAHLDEIGKTLSDAVRLEDGGERNILVYDYESVILESHFIFETVEFLEENGFLSDKLEPLTLQHVRTYMHGLAPSKRFNRASERDALYLLETLYDWKGTGIPVPEKYIDLLKIIVANQKEGEGL